MGQELLSISEVAQASGLQSSALRYYERAGLISSHSRRGGRRYFKAEVLERLAWLALLQEVGFTVREMAVLVRSRHRKERWQHLAENKLREIDEHMERVAQARELLTAAVECTCTGLDACDLIAPRRGRHRKAVQTLSLRMGPPD